MTSDEAKQFISAYASEDLQASHGVSTNDLVVLVQRAYFEGHRQGWRDGYRDGQLDMQSRYDFRDHEMGQ